MKFRLPTKALLSLVLRTRGPARTLLRRGGWPALFLAFIALPFLMLGEPATRPPAQAPTSGSGPSGPQRPVDPRQAGGVYKPSANDLARQSWSWDQAKRLSARSRDALSARTGSPMRSFYCGCDISRRGSTGGDIDLDSCGYSPRRSESRASRLEWEHVVPAAAIGAGRACWTQGAPQCVDAGGQRFAGRRCCEIADPIYNMAATDPVNLVPAIGEVNGDRSDFAYGEVPGEPRLYGQCEMEIDWELDLAEPPASRQGDVARIWAYMSHAYGLTLDRKSAELYARWHIQDPVSAEEIEVNREIRALGHRANPFVLPSE